LVLGVEDHAHRTLLDLGGKLRGLPHVGSVVSGSFNVRPLQSKH
jgi:hypothetical protein